jgi:hypothetical protein
MRGISAILPLWSPLRSRTSRTLLVIFTIVAQVPLQSPHFVSIFLSMSMGHPILRRKSVTGSPDAFKPLRNSVGTFGLSFLEAGLNS